MSTGQAGWWQCENRRWFQHSESRRTILSDSAIFEALDDGRLVITPEPQPRRPSAEAPLVPFDRTSVNLRLGETLRIPRPNLAIAIDLSSGTAGPTLHALYDSRAIPDEGLVLDPNRFILGMTLESIRLPLPDALPRKSPAGGAWPPGSKGRAPWPVLDC